MPATALVQFAVSQRLGLGPMLLGTLAAGGVGATALGVATDAPLPERPQIIASALAEDTAAAPAVAADPPVTPAIVAPVAAPNIPADAGKLAAPPPVAAPAVVVTVGAAAPNEPQSGAALALAAPVPVATLLSYPAVEAAAPAPPAQPVPPAPALAEAEPASALVDDAPAPSVAFAAALPGAEPAPVLAPEAAPVVAVAEPAVVATPAPAEPVRAAEPPVRSPLALAFADLAAQPVHLASPVGEAAPSEPAALVAPVAAPVSPAATPIAALSFDISAMPRPLPPAAPGSAFIRVGEGAKQAAARVPHQAAKLPPIQRYRQTGNGIEFDIGAVLYGEVLGSVPVRVGQTDLVSVRLGDLLALVHDRLAPEAYARLSTARVVNDYVSFSTLRDAGIEVRYDAANDRLILGE